MSAKIFQRIKQSSLVLMMVIIISKLFGMARDVVLANYFGTSNVSDAYLIAVSVPTLLFYFIGHSLSTAYQPMYNKVKEEKGSDAALRYSNNILIISCLLCTVIIVLLMTLTEPVVRLFAAGFDVETVKLTASFIRQSAPSLYFMTLVSIWGGYLHTKRNFIIPAAISLPRNIVIIVSVVLAALVDVSLLGWGLLIAYVAEVLMMLPFVLRNGYRLKWDFHPKEPEIRETLFLVLPIILGVGVSQLNKIIDKSVASTVISGGVSALSYASIINNAVQEVLVTGIITILFTNCSALVAKGEHDQVKKKLSGTIDAMVTLLIPATFGILALARPIVICFLNRGSFDENSVSMTTGALCCYTVGLTFLAVRDTMTKVFYAYKNTRVTTVTSILAILINILLNLILSRFWGINGLAIATSISAIFHCVTLYILLRKRIGDFGLRAFLLTIVKVLLSSAVMFLGVQVAAHLLRSLIASELIRLLICTAIGAVLYGICILILRVPMARKAISRILPKKKSVE